MIRLLLLCFTFYSFNASANDVPETLNIKGSFKFNMTDSSGNLMIGDYIKSPSEITSAMACHLAISADDDYFYSYPVEVSLQKQDGILMPYIGIKALYIDEDSNYHLKEIKSVKYQVADLAIDETSWDKIVVRNNTILLDKTIDKGLLTFHHLTMGQPLKVEVVKAEKPYLVTIDVFPLSQKSARLARKCLELIDA